MSEKFTQGPWEIRKYKDPYGSRSVAVVIATDEIIIAQLGIELDEECAANAHLISAAPEMYEALQAILQYVPISSASEGGAVARSGNVIAADKVRAALKKARGES